MFSKTLKSCPQLVGGVRRVASSHPVSEFLHQRAAATAAAATVDSKLHNDFDNAKPFSQLPGPRGVPILGNIFDLPRVAFSEKGHELTCDMFRKYGPIFRSKVMAMDIVWLSDVEAVKKVHRLEGKYPRRIVLDLHANYRHRNGRALGILLQKDGPEWKRMRSVLDKRMMRPASVATYTDGFNDVITDFISRLRRIRDLTDDHNSVPNIDQELFHWSLETICTVLYEVRLGGLAENREPRTDKFVRAVQDMFTSTHRLVPFPDTFSRLFLPSWMRKHDGSWDTIFETTEVLIAEKMKRLEASDASAAVTGDGASFLEYLLSSSLSHDEIYANISELMAAAVDTTSNTMQWVLHEVSRHKDVQQELHKEVTSITPIGNIPSHEDIQKMSLLKAVIKEVLRLYPIAGVSTRILNEDLELCGYRVPKDTLVLSETSILGRNPDLFEDANSFKPERWLRASNTERLHSFAWLPFGFGPRMCIGRRVAELEMQLLLARISQAFELTADPLPITIASRPIRVPHRPVNVGYVDRA